MKKQKMPMRPSDIKLHNEKLILRSIYAAGSHGRSQSEVVAETNLKAPTVLRFFAQLESDGYIIPLVQSETKTLQKSKGRPAMQFILNKSKHYTVGIEFWAELLSIGVFDFQGNSIYEKGVSNSDKTDADGVCNTIINLITEALELNEISAKDVIGIGIGASGKVDVERGIVIFYPRIKNMKNYPLASIIEKKLEIPVKLHNNCSVIALAESRYGKAKDSKSLFMFLLRSGVNGSFINKGHIYISSTQTTIETGHIPIALDGPICECGKQGCLEALVSKAIHKFSDSNFLEFEKRVEDGDTTAMAEMREVARYIFTAMRVTNNVFKPSSYLFVATSAIIANAISLLIQELDRQEPKSFDSDVLDFFATAYNPQQALKGASDIVIDNFFGDTSGEYE